jgi:hypothetical protein
MKDYPEIEALASYYLEDSYVLGVVAVPGALTLSMEFVLTQDHPEYVSPPPTEQYCYRRGVLKFTGVRSLSWRDQGAMPARDVTGEIDYGNIYSLTNEGDRYEIVGEIGEISVVASTLEVRLE